jgi:hypothetical protein
MTVRSRLSPRHATVVSVALFATFGIIASGDTFSRSQGVPTGAPAVEKPKAEAKHIAIGALRGRMLKSFHGQTTNLFTVIPGFGMERMQPLYKYVPFEIPDLSTNEVEVDKEIAPPKVLAEVFAKSLDGFRDPARPVMAFKLKSPMLPALNPQPGFGAPFSGPVSGGLQLRLLDLVGLMNPDGPRVYSGGKAFEMRGMSAEEAKAERAANLTERDLKSQLVRAAKIAEALKSAAVAKLDVRPLDVFEIAGVAELSQGKQLFVRNRGNVIRMLGALRATQQCLKCHDDQKNGDLLGAFSYTFVDVSRTLEKELTGRSAK